MPIITSKKNMKRLILSILAGFVVTAVLSTGTDHILHVTGVYPPYGQPMTGTGLLLLASAYRVVYQILGGYLIAMVAKEQAKKALWIVGVVGAILWIVGTVAMGEYSTAWYGILGAVLSIPTVLIGGKLYEARGRKIA